MPTAPTDFVIARAGIDSQGASANKAALKFTWTNNQPGATHRIQRKVNARTGTDLFVAGDGQSVATVRKLALNTTYTFRIRAELPGGSFPDWVESAPFLTGKIPTSATQIAPPTNLTVARNDYRGILLTWDDNTANESAHILSISGPGLPAGGVEMNVEHLLSGSKTLPLDYPFAGAYRLQHDMTYAAKVKCRGGKQTKPANTFDTDWTAEEAFTTVAPHIAMVNLPVPEDEPLILLRGQPFSFRVATNISATLLTLVDGELPNGLSLDGDTISGSTSDPEGIYNATIKAEDALTSDTQPFRLVLQTPPFRFTSLPTSLTAWIGMPAKTELRGRNLACWCKLGGPCHAEVLLRVSNWIKVAD